MSFDFASYLESIDPGQAYELETLTGGAVNMTVRARKTSSKATTRDAFPYHPSIILKHAPPYIAVLGPDAKMSQSRQTTEATALSLFQADGPLHHFQVQTTVQVPQLLHHDVEQHVLIISDLGNLFTLSSIFNVLGGVTFDSPSVVNPDPSILKHPAHLLEGEREYYQSLGECLGSFFAQLHSQETLQAIARHESTPLATLSLSPLRELEFEYAIQPLHGYLKRIPDLISLFHTPSSLYERVASNWLRLTDLQEQSLIFGDCWVGAVLVSPPPSLASPRSDSIIDNSVLAVSQAAAQIKVGVIDWEFASILRGVHGDIPQFLADLELFAHVARYHRSPRYCGIFDTLINALIDAYQSIALARVVPWSSTSHNLAHKKDGPPDSDSIRARIIRSGILALGSQILSSAFCKKWPCHDSGCPALDKHARTAIIDEGQDDSSASSSPASGIKSTTRLPSFETNNAPVHDPNLVHQCALVRSAAASAIWLLTHAGKDENEMCEARNWNALLQGPPGWFKGSPEELDDQIQTGRVRRRWLLDIFI